MATNIQKLAQDNGGTLPAYREVGGYEVGGYPLYYLTEINDVLCPECANIETFSEIVEYDVNWEDETLYCDNCSKHIVSAYGDDETEEY